MEIRKKRKLVLRAAVAALVMGGGAAISIAPASANGTGVWLCGQDAGWAGVSDSSGAQTFGSTGCSTHYARAKVCFGPTCGWTNWASSSGTAYASGGGANVWNGQHKVGSCG